MSNNISAVVKEMDKFQPSPNLSRTIKLAARKVNPLNLDRTMKLATTSARVANQSVVGQLATKFSTQAKMNPALKLALKAQRTPSDSVLAMMRTKVSESSSINAVAKLAENLSIASNVGMLANMGLETSRMVHVSPIVESASTLSRVASTNSIGRMAINLSSANTSSLMKVGLKTSNEATTNPALKVDSFVNVGLAVSKTALDSQIRKVLPTIQVTAPSFTKISHRSLTKVRSPYLKVQKSITDSTIINQDSRYLEPFDKLGDLQRSVLIGFNYNQFQKTQLSTVSNGGNIELPRRPYTPKVPNEINEEERLSLVTVLGKTGWAIPFSIADASEFFADLMIEINPYYLSEKDDLNNLNADINKFDVREPFNEYSDNEIMKRYKERGLNIEYMLNSLKNEVNDKNVKTCIERASYFYKTGDKLTCIIYLSLGIERIIMVDVSKLFHKIEDKRDVKAGRATQIMRDTYKYIKAKYFKSPKFIHGYDMQLLYQNMLAFNRVYQTVTDYESYCINPFVFNRNVLVHFCGVTDIKEIDVYKIVLLLYSINNFVIPLLEGILEKKNKLLN